MRVIVFAGPNGSGKSTINQEFLNDPNSGFDGEYINADDIAKTLTHSHADAYARNVRAAEIAEERRNDALANGRTFAYETVMSTPEKVAILTQAKAKGYEVTLVFVTTEDARINVARVANRVAMNGHPVDPAAIVKRYESTMNLLPMAVEHADKAYIFDNSREALMLVATKDQRGLTVLNIPEPPQWLHERPGRAVGQT